MKYIMKNLAPFCLILMLSVLALAESSASDPLVIVVHGIGGGNREDGWSKEIAGTWGVATHEVTFRQEGRTSATSFTDFAREAGDWALDAQSQIKAIVSENPGRRVIIVSHSWGTVVTKMALAGGVGGGRSDKLASLSYNIPPIDLGGVEIEDWVTLGSPLGRADDPKVAGNLRQLHVEVPSGRPGLVKHWTNFYDIDDPVSNQSHNLSGADNIKIDGSGHWWDITGMTAHAGIWQNRRVSSYIWNAALQVSNMPPLTNKAGGEAAAPPADRRRTEPGPATSGGSEAQLLAEYRSLLPAALEANKKPWHTRFNIIANAVKQGTGYRVNYQTYCLIEQGPDKGKDHVCFEFDTVLDLGGVKSAVTDMKRQLGR